jgi:glycosyltransferase involved in cell wall biosynthesis
MRNVLYLTFDSVQEGVGASQALAYVKRLAKDFEIELISFEKEPPSQKLLQEVSKYGITWKPMEFGRYGVTGGISRVFRLWRVINRQKVIHARGNLSALSAMLRFPKAWIWDSRALHSDQRRAISGSSSLEYYFMRTVEYFLAKKSSSIIAITEAVVPIMTSRYRVNRSKIHVISTCVDTELFEFSKIPNGNEVNVLLQGTFSNAYDLVLMNKIIKRMRDFKKVCVTVCTSRGSTNLWEKIDYDKIISVDYADMPQVIAKSDFGMSIWRENLGICLKSVASTKVAEFLAVGRPIIVNYSQGDLKNVVGQNGVGIVTSGITDVEVDQYVQDLWRILGEDGIEERCRQIALEQFNLDLAIEKLKKIYTDLSLT